MNKDSLTMNLNLFATLWLYVGAIAVIFDRKDCIIVTEYITVLYFFVLCILPLMISFVLWGLFFIRKLTKQNPESEKKGAD